MIYSQALETNPQIQLQEDQICSEETSQSLKNKQQKQKVNQIQLQIKKNMREKNLKNFPKLIGNNICKYAEWNQKQFLNGIQTIPKGIQQLIQKKKSAKQVGFKIADLRSACLEDQKSQEIIQIYLKQQLLLDLIYSTKIQDPIAYIPGISNYYAASLVPKKMIGQYLFK